MGFTPEAQYWKYDVTHQGIQSIEDVGHFNEESVKNLCKVLCRTRWAATVSGAQVVDNEFAILVMAETNFQGMVHFISNYDRIERVIVPPCILWKLSKTPASMRLNQKY